MNYPTRKPALEFISNEKWKGLKNLKKLSFYKNLEDIYEISSFGRVRNKISGKIEALVNADNLRVHTTFRFNLKKGRTRSYSIPLLVAEAFLPKSIELLKAEAEGYRIRIKHLKDFNNNQAGNLIWVKYSKK